MAVTKKRKIQASEIEVGNRTLEAVLIDVAERSARAEELSAQAAVRSARAEERAEIALRTIASVTQDLRALTLEIRTSNMRAEGRLDALEKAAGA